LFAAAAASLLDEEAQARSLARASGDVSSPWQTADAWRLGHHGKRIVCFSRDGARVEVDAHGSAGNYHLVSGDTRCSVTNAQADNGGFSAALDGTVHRYRADVDAGRVVLHDGERRVRFDRVSAFAYTPTTQASSDRVLAPMPGRIVLVKVREGEAVAEGQELIVIEAMKMELSLKASHAATIESVNAKQGEFVEADTVLIRFKGDS
jgi:3-methylcrotonyl-CoA carboxylase alpha subunit